MANNLNWSIEKIKKKLVHGNLAKCSKEIKDNLFMYNLLMISLSQISRNMAEKVTIIENQNTYSQL